MHIFRGFSGGYLGLYLHMLSVQFPLDALCFLMSTLLQPPARIYHLNLCFFHFTFLPLLKYFKIWSRISLSFLFFLFKYSNLELKATIFPTSTGASLFLIYFS